MRLLPAAATDFSAAARLTACLLGAFLVAPDVYARQREPDGCYYAPIYSSKKLVLAVTAGLHTDAPNVVEVLQELAVAPGSKLTLVTERKIRKMFKAELKTKKKAALLDGMRLLATQAGKGRQSIGHSVRRSGSLCCHSVKRLGSVPAVIFRARGVAATRPSGSGCPAVAADRHIDFTQRAD